MVENDHTGVSVILLLYLVFWVDALPLNLYEHTHLGERMAVQNYCTFIWIDNLLLMLQHGKLLKVTSSCLHLQTNKALCVHKLCKNPQRKRGHEATHTRDSFFVISNPPLLSVCCQHAVLILFIHAHVSVLTCLPSCSALTSLKVV